MCKGQALLVVCLIIIILGWSAEAMALPVATAVGPEEVPNSIDGVFQSVMMIDVTGDSILNETNASHTFSPTGSAVTLMNAYLVATNADTDAVIQISSDLTVLGLDSRRIGLLAGEMWRVDDLIAAMLLYGAQDAALVLAEHMHGSRDAFTAQMNQLAQDLGMENTVYVNPFGSYDSRQTTTARDLMILAREVYQNDTLRELLSASTYTTYNGQNQIDNRLQLLQPVSIGYDARVTGMGTGATSASGTNMIISARHNGREILMTVYSESTNQTLCEAGVKGWLDYGFNEFQIVDCTQAVSFVVETQGVTLGNGTTIDCAIQDGGLTTVVGRSLAGHMEESLEGFSLNTGEVNMPLGQTLEATLMYNGLAVRNVMFEVLGEAVTPALAVTADVFNNQNSEEDINDEKASPVPDIPFYTSEDWSPAQQSRLGRYGWLVIIIGAAIGCTAVGFILRFVRKRMR